MFFQKMYNTHNFSSSHSQSKRPSISHNRCLSPVGTDPSMHLFQPSILSTSNKSITLSFSKSNRSRRSFRAKEFKENKESIGDINSSTSINFKGRPPKKRNNPSKFYDPRQKLFVDEMQEQSKLSLSKRLLADK